MGLFNPKLVGAIEVRERKPRYEGEPRYKRLDFVKHKSRPKTDDYQLTKTVYPRPQAPQYGAPWEHPQWNSFSHDQQRQILIDLGYQQPPPPPPYQQLQGHPHHHHHQHHHGGSQHGGDIPAPPLHGLPDHNPRRIGPAETLAEVIPLDSSDDDSDFTIEVIRPKKKRPSGHTVFGSDSEDDRSSRYTRSSNGSTMTTLSSVGSSISSRRTHRRGHRGW